MYFLPILKFSYTFHQRAIPWCRRATLLKLMKGDAIEINSASLELSNKIVESLERLEEEKKEK